jgi:hypothetical protein
MSTDEKYALITIRPAMAQTAMTTTTLATAWPEEVERLFRRNPKAVRQAGHPREQCPSGSGRVLSAPDGYLTPTVGLGS